MKIIIYKSHIDIDLFKARRVTGHYRHLPNGKVVFIQQHQDKRDAAHKKLLQQLKGKQPTPVQEKKLAKHKYEPHKVIHSDEKGTTITTHKGEARHFKHEKYHEMSQDDIHGVLNSPLTVDESLGFKHAKMKEEIDDFDHYQKIALEEERDQDEPRFTNQKQFMDWFRKNHINKSTKELQKIHGHVTTWAKAAAGEDGSEIADIFEHTTTNPDQHSSHDHSMAKMAQDHHESAQADLERQEQLVHIADRMRPKDCPMIKGLDKKIEFFGHQAEALAKLDKLEKCILDVDMGGGKGLLLPADALNLMQQGKVKKPLIVVPEATLDQNASIFINEYAKGSVNIFKITNETIKNVYGGDVEAMVKDIRKAPDNTIFMAGYGVFSYVKRDDEGKPVGKEHEDRFERGRTLGTAGFDYAALDECFGPETLVDTPSGKKRIDQIKPGDLVLTAMGEDVVKSVRVKKLDGRVTLRINGETINCSKNHPWFTTNGWMRAKDLKKDDYVVPTNEAMRMVQEGFFSEKTSGDKQIQILRDFLLSEVAMDVAEIGGVSQSRSENKQIEKRSSKSSCIKENERKKSNAFSRCESESICDIESNELGATGTEGQWPRTNSAGKYTYARIARWMGVEFTCVNWKTASGRSNQLQVRSGAPSKEDRDRSGRLLTPIVIPSRARPEKRSDFKCIRVESVEIHESGSYEGNPEGCYYDLELCKHPSFSVANCLVHNSHNIKNMQTSRFQSMKHISKAKYKRVASGTFLSNNPKDVLGQIAWLHPHKVSTEAEFEKKYGREETAKGVRWDASKLKQLRTDLQEMGMISMRRSAWIHKLPERKEPLAISEMMPDHKKVFDVALTDVIEQLEELMQKDKRMAAFMNEDEELENEDEVPPAITGRLDMLAGITDYPHEMALMLKGQYEKVREGRKKDKITEEEAEEIAAAKHNLKKMSAGTRKAILGLEGKVSPKALDAYKKIDKHFANKKNGKYIVFVQRKMSAHHIMENMPEKHKKNAMYFDASKMGQLDSFAKDPDGPKIIVAVDASIKEGMNLQIANGMYRYDHHYPVVEGTLVSSEKGLVPIENLSGTELVDTATTPYNGTAIKSRGIEPTLYIETKHGWRCGFALDHPIMVLDKENFTTTYKLAKDITLDDYIAIKRKGSDLWPETSSYTEDEAYFIGYMISNGWIRTDYSSIGFCDGDWGHRRHFARLLGEVAECEPEARPWKNEVTVYHNERVLQKILDLGLNTNKAKFKKLPLSALTCGKKETIALLKGLWADGTIGSGQPVFTSTSRELSGQVQLLLQRLGIMSKIDFWRNDGTILSDGREIKASGLFHVQVAGGESIQNFVKTFGEWIEIDSPRNQKINKWTQKTMSLKVIRSNWDSEIPGIKPQLRVGEYPVKHWYDVSKVGYKHIELCGASNDFERLMETKLTWSKVSSVKDGGVKRVWCIVDVNQEHNFVANGMVVHNSPGNQEQSYARIWRFGQDKPVDINIGIVNGGVDVCKYARMISKHHQNIQVTSEFPEDETFEAYKLNLDNLSNHREAHELKDYTDKNKEIIDFQHQENKELRKRYGDKSVPRSGGPLKGGEILHGTGAYHTEFTGKEKAGKLEDHEFDALVGHTRDAMKKHKVDHFDEQEWRYHFPEIAELAGRHKLRGGGKKLDAKTLESYRKETEFLFDEKIKKKDMDVLTTAVNSWASGKKHTPHEKAYEESVPHVLKTLNVKGIPAKAHKMIAKDAKVISQMIADAGLSLDPVGKKASYQIEDEERLNKKLAPIRKKYKDAHEGDMIEHIWQKFEKSVGEEIPASDRKMLELIAAHGMTQSGGWSSIKEDIESRLRQ